MVLFIAYCRPWFYFIAQYHVQASLVTLLDSRDTTCAATAAAASALAAFADVDRITCAEVASVIVPMKARLSFLKKSEDEDIGMAVSALRVAVQPPATPPQCEEHATESISSGTCDSKKVAVEPTKAHVIVHTRKPRKLKCAVQ